jgi:radical SAM superfamily enzyme YgiQ (UPF0313 family)
VSLLFPDPKKTRNSAAAPDSHDISVARVKQCGGEQPREIAARGASANRCAPGRLADRLSAMAEIVLSTLNARYAHAAFGLRYLMANLGPLRDRAEIVEFDISQRSVDVVERILERRPRIVGLGVYIWNIDLATRVVADLKRIRPETVVILGGPEVSYETAGQEIARLADYVITGEADLAFAQLCHRILEGRSPEPVDDPGRPGATIIAAELPDFSRIELPYSLYSDRDIAERVIYVEASRGCPYECEFCLSSLEIPVRQAPLEAFLAAMQDLLDRGARQFKFVDRTFNLNLRVSSAILEFFLERLSPELFLHFEMIPDRLPESLRALIRSFPKKSLQFEVGIQTFDPGVALLISRRQNNDLVESNLRWLRTETGVHIHADLIVGLPGESLESFAAGFDRLVALEPHEIQVGMLKRLRGTPIARHDETWRMTYSPYAPYEILQTRLIDYTTMQRLRRFARYWDLVANSGNFRTSSPLLWEGGSPFAGFMRFSDWLFEQSGSTNGISLKRLAEFVFRFLTAERPGSAARIAEAVWHDYQSGGRSDVPEFFRPFLASVARASAPAPRGVTTQRGAARQARHTG